MFFGAGFYNFSFWWLFPGLMMGLCLLFMVRGRKGNGMCCFGPRRKKSQVVSSSDSAMEILDKQYATGQIDEKEYEKKKIILTWDK